MTLSRIVVAEEKARTTRGEQSEEEEGCWSPGSLGGEREQVMVEETVRTTSGELSGEEAKEEGEGGCRDSGRLDRKREGLMTQEKKR